VTSFRQIRVCNDANSVVVFTYNIRKKACYNSGVLVQLIAYVGPTSVSDSYSK